MLGVCVGLQVVAAMQRRIGRCAGTVKMERC
jgi:hypothetical protein